MEIKIGKSPSPNMSSLCRGFSGPISRSSFRFVAFGSPIRNYSVDPIGSKLQERPLHYNQRIQLLQFPFKARMESSAANGGDNTVFPLSSSSVLKISKGDITKWFVDGSSDAIVNPANERMLGGGGADGAIHRAAGPELLSACYKVPEVRPGIRCPTGEARITPGFKLPASHVIHTVGPIYDVDPNPAASLKNAYRNSLKVAKENNIKYIAFPAISCGVYGYPYDEAASVAVSTAKEFSDGIKEVHFVLFSDEILNAWLKAARELLTT